MCATELFAIHTLRLVYNTFINSRIWTET